MNFICIVFFFSNPFHFAPVDLECPIALIIIRSIELDFYNVIFLFFSISNVDFSTGVMGYECFHIPLSYDIHQKKLLFLTKLFRCYFRIFCGNLMEQLFHILLITKAT